MLLILVTNLLVACFLPSFKLLSLTPTLVNSSVSSVQLYHCIHETTPEAWHILEVCLFLLYTILQATKTEKQMENYQMFLITLSWYVTASVILHLLCILWTADVDECAGDTDMCHLNANCSNTEGSYTCSCNSAYAGNGFSCTSKCMCLHMRTCS